MGLRLQDQILLGGFKRRRQRWHYTALLGRCSRYPGKNTAVVRQDITGEKNRWKLRMGKKCGGNDKGYLQADENSLCCTCCRCGCTGIHIGQVSSSVHLLCHAFPSPNPLYSGRVVTSYSWFSGFLPLWWWWWQGYSMPVHLVPEGYSNILSMFAATFLLFVRFTFPNPLH